MQTHFPTRRSLLAASLGAATLGIAPAVGAQTRIEMAPDIALWHMGRPVPSPGQVITVQVLFSYFSRHSREFDPYLDQWMPTLPRHVQVERVAVAQGDVQTGLQRLFYALAMTGQIAQVHASLYAEASNHRSWHPTQDYLVEFAQRHRLDAGQLIGAWQAFSTITRVAAAQRIYDTVPARGMPSILVANTFSFGLPQVSGMSADQAYRRTLQFAGEVIQRLS